MTSSKSRAALQFCWGASLSRTLLTACSSPPAQFYTLTPEAFGESAPAISAAFRTRSRSARYFALDVQRFELIAGEAAVIDVVCSIVGCL